MASFLNGVGSHPAALLAPLAEVVRGSAGMEGTIKFNKRHVPGRWRGRAEAGSRLSPAGAGTFGSNREGV